MSGWDQATVDYVAIRRLQDAYADIVSRRAFAELRDIFASGVVIALELPGRTREVTGAEAFGEYVAKRIAHLEFFQFVVLNAVIDVEGDDPDRASGRMWMCELNQDRASGRFTTLYGLYRDEYARVDGRWWFAHRRFSPLALTHSDLEVFEPPDFGS